MDSSEERPVDDELDATLPSADETMELSEALQATLQAADIDPHQTMPDISLRPHTASEHTLGGSAVARPRAIRSTPDAAESETPDSAGEDPDYLILDQLGEGGMGTVHLARQVALGREVALKQVRSNSPRPSAKDEFFTEAVLTGKLEHPNIVPVYELGHTRAGDLFYAMKNIRGEAWDSTLAKRSLDENLDILINVCDAIAFAHAEGVIHRDLKPQNIMIGGFGEVLVLDWGLALLAGPEGVEVRAVAGSPWYLAPEMARAPTRLGPTCDVYLLGAMLYEVVGGAAPHRFNEIGEALASAEKNTMVPPDEERVQELDPSGELLRVARRAMKTNPEDRYQTVAELQQAIRDFLSHRESLLLASNAEASLVSARDTRDYTHFSRAVFGFEEALKLWEGNTRATVGAAEARMAWAKCAEAQRDYDLALSLLNDSTPEQREMRKRVTAAKQERDAHRQHVRRLRRFGVAASITVAVVATVAAVWINRERTRAEQARTAAVAAREGEAEQRKIAEAKEQEAQTQRRAAEEAEARARREAEVLAWQLYRNHIHSAMREWDNDIADGARRYLDAAEHPSSGWEYRYLKSRFDRDSMKFQDIPGARQAKGLAFSPDGRTLFSSSNTELVLWDASSGAPRQRLSGHGHFIRDLALSPDGKQAVTAGHFDKSIRLWDTDTGKTVRTIDAFSYSAHCAALAPHGRRIAGGGAEKGNRHGVKMWDAKTGELLWTAMHKANDPVIRTVTFSPDGQRLLMCRDHGSIKVFNTETGEVLLELRNAGYNRSVAFSPDGQRIAGGSMHGELSIWHAETGERQLLTKAHTDRINTVVFRSDGRQIATGSVDKTIRIWDADSGRPVRRLMGHEVSVESLAFSPNGRRLASCGYMMAADRSNAKPAEVKLWDLQPPAVLLSDQSLGPFIDFDSDGRRIAIGDDRGAVRIWDLEASREVMRTGQHYNMQCMDMSADGRWIVTGGSKEGVKVWDAASGKLAVNFTEHTSYLLCLAVSPDSRLAASGGADNALRIWRLDSGEPLHVLSHPKAVQGVAFSPDGTRIATVADDGIIRLWETETGHALDAWKGHRGRAATVRFSPDGRTLVTGGSDTTVRLWHAETGKAVHTLEGHTMRVLCVAFSPDGSRIASGGQDKKIKLWDTITGHELLSLQDNKNKITTLAFSPDGSRLVNGSGGRERIVRLRDALAAPPATRWQRAAQTENGPAAYHEALAEDAERMEDWYAAQWHLDRLRELNPEEPSLRQRQAHAVEKLDAWKRKREELLAGFE